MNLKIALALSILMFLVLGGSASAQTLSTTATSTQITVSTTDWKLIWDGPQNNGGIRYWYDLVNSPSENLVSIQGDGIGLSLYGYYLGGTTTGDELSTHDDEPALEFVLLESSETRTVIKARGHPSWFPDYSGLADTNVEFTEIYTVYPTGKIGIKFDSNWLQPETLLVGDRGSEQFFLHVDGNGNWHPQTEEDSSLSHENDASYNGNAKTDSFILFYSNGGGRYADVMLSFYGDWSDADAVRYERYSSQDMTHLFWKDTDEHIHYGVQPTRYFMSQLGTYSSDILPDLNSNTAADPYNEDYQNPDTLSFTIGSRVGDGFDEGELAYTMSADGNRVEFTLSGSTLTRYKPVFKITGYTDSFEPGVRLNGAVLTKGIDYNLNLDTATDTIIMQYLGDIDYEAEFVLTPDWDTLSKAERYAPTLLFDDEEPWYPVAFDYDSNWWALDNNEYWDEGVERDPPGGEAVGQEDEWYDYGDDGKSSLVGYGHDDPHQSNPILKTILQSEWGESGNPPLTLYYKVRENADYVVYEYWVYYVYNSYPFQNPYDYHEHDWESVFVWVNKSNGIPYHLVTSEHIGNGNSYEITNWEHQRDGVYVGLGSHAMALDLSDFEYPENEGEGDGRAVQYGEWNLIDIDASELYTRSGGAYDIDGINLGDDVIDVDANNNLKIDYWVPDYGYLSVIPIAEDADANFDGIDELSTNPATSYDDEIFSYSNYYSFMQIDYYEYGIFDLKDIWKMRSEGIWDDKEDGTRENTPTIYITVPWVRSHYWFPENLWTSNTISQGSTQSYNINVKGSTPEVKFELSWPGSDLDLHVYDPQGRHVGYNYNTNEVEIEVPGAEYSGRTARPEWVRIQSPEPGSWRIETYAYQLEEEEPYELETDTPEFYPILTVIPAEINKTVVEGTSDMFIAQIPNIGNLPLDNIDLMVSGPVSDWISLDTTHISSIGVGNYTNVTLTISVPGGQAQGNYSALLNVTSGNARNLSIPISITVPDTTPPSVIIHSPQNKTYSTRTIDLEVSANEPIDTWIYSLNSAGNTTFTPNATITGEEGLNNIIVYANDTAGNMNSSTVWFTADTTPPVTTDNYDSLWHKSDITITLTATDANGINETYYKINSGPTKTISANGQPVITTESANNTLEYWSVDVVTNEELPHNILTDIKLDKTAPTTTDDVPAGWQNTDVTVTLTPTDNTSGVADTYYCVDQTSTCTPTTVGTSVLVSDEGTNYVRYYSVDNAGNNETVKSATVQLDKTPPNITITTPLSTNYSYTKDITLDFNAIDGLSGIASLSAYLDDTPVTGGQVIELFDFILGEHVLTVTAVDNAGNNAAEAVTFNVIDDIPPLTIDDADEGWHTADITVTLTSDDEKSDVTEVHYIINDGPEVAVTVDTDTIIGDPFVASAIIDYEHDNNTVEYWAVDEWGNVEEHHFVDGIKLDKTEPITEDDYDGLWHAEDITITLTAIDPVVQGMPSGVADTYYVIYEDEVPQGTKSVSVDGQPVITYEDDDNWLEYWSMDVAGNEEAHIMKKGIKLDKTPPAITITSPENTTYNTHSVDLGYSVTDALSGIGWVGYSLDGQPNVTTTGEVTTFIDTAGEDVGTVTDIPFGNVGTSTIYIAVPKNATVYSASMNVSGYAGYSYYTQDEENASGYDGDWTSPDNAYDEDWDTAAYTHMMSGGSIYEDYILQSSDTNYINVTVKASDSWSFYVYNFTGSSWDERLSVNSQPTSTYVIQLTGLSDYLNQSSFKTRFYAPSSGVEYYESRITVVGNTLYNPSGVSIDTGSDGVTDWSMAGELDSANSPQTVDLNITAIQAYLNNCTTDICNVPLDISSDTAGIVQLDALSVKYYSSATLTSLSSGGHNVTVYASDAVGNMDSSTVYFTVMRMGGR